MATKNSIFTSVISGSPTITSEKLIGSENYLSWSASVELWFMGQGYEDHLIAPEDDIPGVDKVQWKKIDAQLCSVLWQSVDPKILLHLRAYKTCSKFWNQAKALYTNDIQRLYKVASAIVNIRQQDMELSNYIGQIASLKEEFLTLMPLTSVVGSTQLRLVLMVRLIALRPAWLLKDILRFMVLIMVTPSPLLPRLLLSVCFSPWLLCVPGRFFSWILKMLSFMVISPRKFIWSNHLVLLLRGSLV